MNNDEAINYPHSDNILHDIEAIIETSRQHAYQAVDTLLLRRNWLLGRRIAEEELQKNGRAEYGLELIKNLSKQLTKKYGKGFTKSNLYNFYLFYKMFPEIFQTLSGKSQHLLSWSHYAVLLRVQDSSARAWYIQEALQQAWSVRTLQRNIETQYYFRLLSSSNKETVANEMIEKTKEFQQDKLEYLKNPIIAEFLGLSSNIDMTESQLETAILSNLQKFLMELGKGYAFVARQQHIQTEQRDYYIDLVFYNYILKCFVLIDLKIGKINHQDIGQMDMYIRMYDELKKNNDDNPTLGIVLCSETDKDIAQYSVMHGNEQLFATKYKLYLHYLPQNINFIYPQKKNYEQKLNSKKPYFIYNNNRKKKFKIFQAA